MKINSLLRVWCFNCLLNTPPKLEKAAFLIPKRQGHYWSDDKDRRVIGICNECLEDEDDFKKKNTIDVDVDHPYLYRSCVQ